MDRKSRRTFWLIILANFAFIFAAGVGSAWWWSVHRFDRYIEAGKYIASGGITPGPNGELTLPASLGIQGWLLRQADGSPVVVFVEGNRGRGNLYGVIYHTSPPRSPRFRIEGSKHALSLPNGEIFYLFPTNNPEISQFANIGG